MSRLREKTKAVRHPRTVLLTLCLGVLMAQVDTSVVNLAVRRIGADLGAGMAGLQWVLDGYNLAYAALLLTGGALGDLYGRRRVFAIGVAVFALGSAACALAPGLPMLIAGRAVAGAGAALLLPCSLAMLRVAWPDPAERGRALGVWAGCNGAATAIGPTLGGALIRAFGWRSVFLLVLPLSIAALVLALRCLPESADPRGRRLDPAGQALGALALGALALGVIGGAGAVGRAVAFAAAAAAFVAFLAVERRGGAAALVPLALFARPGFRGALAVTGAMTFGMYGLLFLLPLCWQAAGALDVGGAGIALLPMSLAFLLLSSRSGRLAERFGARAMTACGMALIGAGLLILAGTRSGAPLALAEAGLTLTGIGMALNTGPVLGVAVEAAPPARAGTASALANAARMVGATLGVAVSGALFEALGGGGAGLRGAMLAGGAVALGGAAVAWRMIRTG